MRVIKGHQYLIGNMIIVPQKSGNILESDVYCELLDLNMKSTGCLNVKLEKRSEIEELFDEVSEYHNYPITNK